MLQRRGQTPCHQSGLVLQAVEGTRQDKKASDTGLGVGSRAEKEAKTVYGERNKVSGAKG